MVNKTTTSDQILLIYQSNFVGEKLKLKTAISLKFGTRKAIIKQFRTSLKVYFDSLEGKTNELSCEEGFIQFQAIFNDNLNHFFTWNLKRVNDDKRLWIKTQVIQAAKQIGRIMNFFVGRKNNLLQQTAEVSDKQIKWIFFQFICELTRTKKSVKKQRKFKQMPIYSIIKLRT